MHFFTKAKHTLISQGVRNWEFEDPQQNIVIAKRLCRFSLEHNSLWHKVIASKYGPHPFERLSRGVKVTYRDLWKGISKKSPSFAPFVRCVVG